MEVNRTWQQPSHPPPPINQYPKYIKANPHHQCKRRQHPFQDANFQDVSPIITTLLAQSTTSPTSPAFTTAFTTAAHRLVHQASALSDPTAAAHLLLRATALARIAAHSSSSSPSAAEARTLQQTIYRRATDLLWPDSPLDDGIRIPNMHAEFDMHAKHQPRRAQIPISVRIPLETLYTGAPCPAVLLFTPDRTGCTALIEAAFARGWGCVVVEETDSAGAGVGPSVMDWMMAVGFWDMQRVVAVVSSSHSAELEGLDTKLSGLVVLCHGDEKSTIAGCPVLVVDGASATIEAHGLWMPTATDEHDGFVAPAEYASGLCVGQLGTADWGRVFGWMENVMEGRDNGLPLPWDVVEQPTPPGSRDGLVDEVKEMMGLGLDLGVALL